MLAEPVLYPELDEGKRGLEYNEIVIKNRLDPLIQFSGLARVREVRLRQSRSRRMGGPAGKVASVFVILGFNELRGIHIDPDSRDRGSRPNRREQAVARLSSFGREIPDLAALRVWQEAQDSERSRGNTILLRTLRCGLGRDAEIAGHFVPGHMTAG